MPAFAPLGRPLGGRRSAMRAPRSLVPRSLRRAPRRSLPYEKIRDEIMAIVGNLPPEQAAQIPVAGTLPEIMTALGLLWSGLQFASQISEDGGRTRLGGAVVDFKVFMGAEVVIVRVQGDYWHSLPERVLMDVVQYERLKQMGYRVADLWESAIYEAYQEGRLAAFVMESVLNAG